MKDVGFGVVGAGGISGWHITAINNSRGGRLVAIADVVRERAEAVASEHGVRCYGDHREMLRDPDIDAVCVCTPSGLRGEICIDAARAGKHIIAEKPLEITLEKVDAVLQACSEGGVKLACILQIRYQDGVVALKSAVDDGLLGRLVLGSVYVKWHRSQNYYDSATWRGTWALDGGGVLMNQAIHYIDLLRWVMGPVESVVGHTDTLARERLEVEDTAVACLRFTSGAMGVIEACTSASIGMPWRLEVIGEHGSVVVENGYTKMMSIRGKELAVPQTQPGKAAGASDPSAIDTIGHCIQIQDMIDAIREDRPPAIDGREGRHAIELISAIYASARVGGLVKLPLET